MPKKVWKELVKIQRVFLWAGLSKHSKTCWVKWDVICKPKKEGGLGVRNLRLVNVSLLAKWKWKLLSRDDELWKDVVVARYGRDVMGKRRLGEIDVSRTGSSWWRDICFLDKDSDWFNNAVGKKVGNGNATSFWNEIWVGTQSLRERFPRLYGISLQKEEVIGNVGVVADGEWHWNLQWRRNLFVWEEVQYRDFLDAIETFVPSDQVDRWLWMGDDLYGFSENSAYLSLVIESNPFLVCDPVMKFVLNYLWKCGAPSKVSAFSWQLLLDRIQTKDNLVKRCIIDAQQGQCDRCMLGPETALHLFLHCDYAAKIWYEMVSWLGLIIILPHDIASSLAILLNCGKNKSEKVGLCLVWNAFMWVLWKVRNNHIFNHDAAIVDDLVEEIKILSWRWFIGKIAKGPFLLYEWKWDPLACMRC
jgi:hypothetical protein